MANIRIDTDGLQNNISSMRAYVNELDSLNARTQSLLAQIEQKEKRIQEQNLLCWKVLIRMKRN